jgi:hypothetical protein
MDILPIRFERYTYNLKKSRIKVESYHKNELKASNKQKVLFTEYCDKLIY